MYLAEFLFSKVDNFQYSNWFFLGFFNEKLLVQNARYANTKW